MITDGGEPECYQEAMSHEHKGEWIKAMPEEERDPQLLQQSPRLLCLPTYLMPHCPDKT